MRGQWCDDETDRTTYWTSNEINSSIDGLSVAIVLPKPARKRHPYTVMMVASQHLKELEFSAWIVATIQQREDEIL